MARTSQRSATSPRPQPTEAEVRTHLDTLLHSEALAISDRNRRFLGYIVEETLAGRGDRIKAYNVALTAFDRTDDFDPQTDPIVRIEASRLRRALEHYYLTAGKADPLRIGVPKGSYVATFSYAALEPASLPAGERPLPSDILPSSIAGRRPLPIQRPPIWWIGSTAVMLLVVLAWLVPALVDQAVGRAQVAAEGTSILLLPLDADASHTFVARGITAELIERLAPLDAVAVIDQGVAHAENEVDFVLSGSTHVVGNKIYITAALADSESGRFLWSWNVERSLIGADLIGVEAALAGEIADGIGPLIQPQRN